MLGLENAEELLLILERYTKLKSKDIPQELDEYLSYVARTGDPVYRWSTVQYFFREKLITVIKDFHDNSPSIEDLPQCPNVDAFNYETLKTALLERLDLFHAAPFTIQRLSELLNDPRKHYRRLDKFMRALEKNILVVSTIEPGRKAFDSENGESVNGDALLDVNVDVEMDKEPSSSCNTTATVSIPTIASDRVAIPATHTSTSMDDENLPKELPEEEDDEETNKTKLMDIPKPLTDNKDENDSKLIDIEGTESTIATTSTPITTSISSESDKKLDESEEAHINVVDEDHKESKSESILDDIVKEDEEKTNETDEGRSQSDGEDSSGIVLPLECENIVTDESSSSSSSSNKNILEIIADPFIIETTEDDSSSDTTDSVPETPESECKESNYPIESETDALKEENTKLNDFEVDQTDTGDDNLNPKSPKIPRLDESLRVENSECSPGPSLVSDSMNLINKKSPKSTESNESNLTSTETVVPLINEAKDLLPKSDASTESVNELTKTPLSELTEAIVHPVLDSLTGQTETTENISKSDTSLSVLPSSSEINIDVSTDELEKLIVPEIVFEAKSDNVNVVSVESNILLEQQNVDANTSTITLTNTASESTEPLVECASSSVPKSLDTNSDNIVGQKSIEFPSIPSAVEPVNIESSKSIIEEVSNDIQSDVGNIENVSVSQLSVENPEKMSVEDTDSLQSSAEAAMESAPTAADDEQMEIDESNSIDSMDL